MKLVIIAVLAIIAIALVIKALRKKADKPAELPEPNLADLKIQDARVGDVVSIRAAGDEFEDLGFTVDRRHRYESGRDRHYEISGLYKNRRIHVEWSDDDDLEIAVSKETKLSISKLGVTEEDLARMDEHQDTPHTITYENTTWRFEGSGEIGFFENDGSEGEGYYNWDFESDDGSRWLCVEKWEGTPFEASVSERVDPEDVTIFRG